MAAAPGDTAELQNDRGVFRAEYERELGQWLRRRLGWLCIAYAVFQILSTTALILTSTRSGPFARPSQPQVLTPIEIRADRAEKRADAGLPPKPGDARAIEVAKELEQRRAERERGAEAVVSTLDAFSEIAKGISREVRDVATESKSAREPGGGLAGAPAVGRMADRWWEETSAPVATAADAPASARSASARATSTPAPTANKEIAISKPADVGDQMGLRADGTAASATALGSALDAALATAGESESIDVPRIPWWIWAILTLPILGVVAWYGLAVRPRLYTRAELVTAASRMILTLGLLNFTFESALLLSNPDATVTPLLSIFFWHFTASMFLPWNWRESLRPIVPVFLCWVLLQAGLAATDGSWLQFLLTVAFAPLAFVPALLLCYVRLRWHQNRFKSGFVGRRFLQMRREFLQARAVHESLFPKPLDSGWMRFDFGYRPAADIGGDFIHVWIDERERFHLALIDVTGHGLASAMSVARIHGEIERLRDEYPEEGPAKILLRLNRYFHRLLARHTLFATGVLLMIDPHSGELRYASAGHPPVFIRTRERVVELPSTTLLLGAVDDSMFGEEEVTIKLEEGDTIVLFTDGAYDARSPRGERFGLDRLREIMQRPTAPPRWTQYLMRLVETFEAGMPEDDLLIAEIHFVSRRSISSVTGDDIPMPAQEYAGARA